MNIPLPIPTVRVLTRNEGECRITPDTRIIFTDERDRATADWLHDALSAPTGYSLPVSYSRHTSDQDESARTHCTIRLTRSPEYAPEGYSLNVSTHEIVMCARESAGLFYAGQVLLQLLPPCIYRRAQITSTEKWSIPCVHIEDEPRFRWRGLMLDTARHFIPKREILRIIDFLALHRLNVLHLHLTDDQGWRMEIKQYPRLTEIGGWRKGSQISGGAHPQHDERPHGGFYTQDDLREIVAYASSRHITVVPEIDSPGHVQAALAAYPEFGVTGSPLPVCTSWGIIENVLNMEDTTVEFFKNVLDEVMAVFPSSYVGIGGDECPKTQWRTDPRTQERMRELDVANEDELQSWFIHQLDEHVSSAGRHVFGWDEILEGGLAPGATVASWRGLVGAVSAARAGHDVVSTPDDVVYLNYRASESTREPIPVGTVLTLRDVYHFDPVPPELTEEEAQHILGGQANVWTEFIDSPRVLDYHLFPRLCAAADALWRTKPADFDAFREALDSHLERLTAWGVEYRPADGPLPWQRRPGIVGRPVSQQEREEEMNAITRNIRPE